MQYKKSHGCLYYFFYVSIIFPLKLFFCGLCFVLSMCKIALCIIFKKNQKNYASMTGLEFEEYAASILKQKGFHSVQVTQGSGDQGIDVFAEKKGLRYAIQVKNYAHPVGNKAVQEAYSGCAYYGCDIPVVLTNSTFTPSAKELAIKTGVQLWNIDKL